MWAFSVYQVSPRDWSSGLVIGTLTHGAILLAHSYHSKTSPINPLSVHCFPWGLAGLVLISYTQLPRESKLCTSLPLSLQHFFLPLSLPSSPSSVSPSLTHFTIRKAPAPPGDTHKGIQWYPLGLGTHPSSPSQASPYTHAPLRITLSCASQGQV